MKKDKVWTFILAGQSNMAGRGAIEPQDTITCPGVLSIDEKSDVVAAKEPVHFYEPGMNGVGCALAFGKELRRHVPDDISILLVPTAVGGSSIEQWLENSTHRNVQLFSNFMEKAAIGKRCGEVKAILWHQGESDATTDGISGHREKLSLLFNAFRDAVDDRSLPILIGELGAFSKEPANWARMNEQFRLYAASDPHSAIISTSDLEHIGDFLHFNSAGQREMGKRFAKKWIAGFP